jgi:hypothetical protein
MPRPKTAGRNPDINPIDMRTGTRRSMLQRCFVYPTGGRVEQAWRSIAFNLSTTGIGITVPIQLIEGTMLTIRAWELPRARDLQARVVQAKWIESQWFTGCELIERLTEVELQVWCGGKDDWLNAAK